MAWVLTSSGFDRADFIDAEGVSAALLASCSGNQATNTQTGVIDVRRWQFLQISANTATVGRALTIFVVWSADQAGLISVGAKQFTSKTDVKIMDTVPMMGPYMNVGILFDDAGTHDVTCSVLARTQSGFNGSGFNTGNNPDQMLASIAFGLVGAGATVFQEASFVQSGWATLFLDCDTAAGVVGIQALRTDGTFGVTYGAVGVGMVAGRRETTLIAIPSAQVRIFLSNTSGVAMNAGAALMMGPRF